MKIVTTGRGFVDIDGYAGCVAYAELLQTQGSEAAAVSTVSLNESVTHTVRSWRAPFALEYTTSENDTFTVIDVSDPEHFDKIVALARVEEVIDHHPGFERYWQERIGEKARIEFIGAACTLVYERWKAVGLLEKMSTTSARLLVCGILDNTLNFGAAVTTERDIDAYDALLPLANLPADWTAQYFTDCQEAILGDGVGAIRNDTKTLMFQTYGQRLLVGQLVVWDGKQVLDKYKDPLRAVFADSGPGWFINLVSINEKRNYLISDNPQVQAWLSKLLAVQFKDSIAVTSRLWLRKEIIKQDIEASEATAS